MPMENHDIAAESANIAGSVKKILAKIKGIHGGISSVFAAAPFVVAEVEKVSAKWAGVTGDEKKDMAVEALLIIIPLPRWLPKFVARAIISWAIEAALKELKKFGKK